MVLVAARFFKRLVILSPCWSLLLEHVWKCVINSFTGTDLHLFFLLSWIEFLLGKCEVRVIECVIFLRRFPKTQAGREDSLWTPSNWRVAPWDGGPQQETVLKALFVGEWFFKKFEGCIYCTYGRPQGPRMNWTVFTRHLLQESWLLRSPFCNASPLLIGISVVIFLFAINHF